MPWTEVQRTSRVVGGFNSPVDLTFPSNVSAGNLILVEMQANFSYGSPNDITGFTVDDDLTNSYSTVFVNGSNSGGGISYCISGSSGANTVSALALTNSTPTPNDTGIGALAIEYSGINTSTPLVGSNTLPSDLGTRSISLASAPPAGSLVYSLYCPDGGQSLVTTAPTITGFTHSVRNLSGDGYGDSVYGTAQQTCAWPDQMVSGGAAAIIIAFAIASSGTIYTITPSGGFTLSGTNPLLKNRVYNISGGLVLGGTVLLAHQRVIVVSGGVVFNGSAPISTASVYVLTVSGGITFAGTVIQNHTNEIVPAGGVIFSGTVAELKTRAIIPSGGILLSGSVVQNHTNEILPSGGVAFGGTAPITTSAIYVITPSGGISFAGTADQRRINEILVSGGLTFAGTVNQLRTRAILPSGGVLFTGSVSFEQIKTIYPSGGIVFSGSAGIVFIPAGTVTANQISRITVGLGRSVRVS